MNIIIFSTPFAPLPFPPLSSPPPFPLFANLQWVGNEWIMLQASSRQMCFIYKVERRKKLGNYLFESIKKGWLLPKGLHFAFHGISLITNLCESHRSCKHENWKQQSSDNSASEASYLPHKNQRGSKLKQDPPGRWCWLRESCYLWCKIILLKRCLTWHKNGH